MNCSGNLTKIGILWLKLTDFIRFGVCVRSMVCEIKKCLYSKVIV